MNQHSFKYNAEAFKNAIVWQLNDVDSLGELQSRRDVLIRDVKITSDLFKKMVRAFKKESRESSKGFLFMKPFTMEVMRLLKCVEKCIHLIRMKSPIPLKHSQWDLEITLDIYEGMQEAIKEMCLNVYKLM
jgi:hypothetical protein